MFEILGLQEITEFVDLVKRFPMSIWSQKSASIQPRMSLLKFEDLITDFADHSLYHMPNLFYKTRRSALIEPRTSALKFGDNRFLR